MPCWGALSAPLRLCACSGVLPRQLPAAKGHTPFWEAVIRGSGACSLRVTSDQRSMQCHVHRSSSWFDQLLNNADLFSYNKIAIQPIELVTTASSGPEKIRLGSPLQNTWHKCVMIDTLTWICTLHSTHRWKT